MTKKLLNTFNIENMTKEVFYPKRDHETISTYVISNYLFKNIDDRISFFRDINILFGEYLDKFGNEYFSSITTTKLLHEVKNILDDNIKLVYKGGNMINHYLATFKNVFTKVGVDPKLDTLSDFDFSILINYDYILENTNVAKDNLEYIKLSRLGDLIAFHIVKHFNNYMFCFRNDILKNSIVNKTNNYPNTEYYKFGDINNAEIGMIFDYVNNYFSNIINLPKDPNIFNLIKENIEQINNKNGNDNLPLLFNIVTECTKSQVNFVGFSLPTTFNKHKNIFTELRSINADNSMKLTTFVKNLINQLPPQRQNNLDNNIILKNKIELSSKLRNLNERYDRITTKNYEIYPSDDTGDYCIFYPLALKQLIARNINVMSDIMTTYSKDAKELNLNNFYNVISDNLLLTEDIKYKNFIKTRDPESKEFVNIFINKYFQSNENLVSISLNHSLLFGTKLENNDWSRITNFNLVRGKIPIRYYFKLTTPYLIDTKQIQYIFIDYLGELIDISIPTYGDSDFRNNFIGNNPHDNTNFKYKLNYVNINGIAIHNSINVLTHTLEYFIFDIYQILFQSREGIPWKALKYHKRMNRIIKLYLVYLKSNYDNVTCLEKYETFICCIEKIVFQFKSTGNIDISEVLTPDISDNIFIRLINNIDNLSKRILESDKNNMIEFLDILLCYLKSNNECLTKFYPNVENNNPFSFLAEPTNTHHLLNFRK
jgi:hypothetical protein